MRRFIERVTITGADDTVKPQDLLRLSKKYGFVEWGILLSKNQIGTPRFPTKKWLLELYEVASLQHFMSDFKFQLSGHLCGQYVRDIAKGRWTFLDNNEELAECFDRFQLNFHGENHIFDEYNFLAGFNDERLTYKQIILQLDGVNDKLLPLLKTKTNAVGLFDVSHGAGVLPETWPTSNEYIGYAGGLSPDNVVENIEGISEVAKNNIWIDFETHARNYDNGKNDFDLDKCETFLKNCEPYILRYDNV